MTETVELDLKSLHMRIPDIGTSKPGRWGFVEKVSKSEYNAISSALTCWEFVTDAPAYWFQAEEKDGYMVITKPLSKKYLGMYVWGLGAPLQATLFEKLELLNELEESRNIQKTRVYKTEHAGTLVVEGDPKVYFDNSVGFNMWKLLLRKCLTHKSLKTALQLERVCGDDPEWYPESSATIFRRLLELLLDPDKPKFVNWTGWNLHNQSHGCSGVTLYTHRAGRSVSNSISKYFHTKDKA